MSESRKNVVVVGAGYAGTAVASALSKKLNASQYNVVLVSPRPYAVALTATLRLVISEAANLEESALVPLDKLFKPGKGEVKVGVVQSIEPRDAQSGGDVLLESGERLPYEILILAPGSKWKGAVDIPANPDEVTPHIHAWRAKYAKANHVVIVGGGAVGIEMAGELKDVYPDKKVTIVQGDRQLLNSTYPAALREGLAKRLVARGVELHFNEYVDTMPEEGVVGLVTRKGTSIPDADLVVWARGPSPNTAFVASLGESALSASGFIKVKPTLQLTDHARIFAMGDVIDWPEQKQAAKTHGHAGVIVKNVANILAGKSNALANYGGSPELIVITNGKDGGMCYFPFFGGVTLGDFFARLFKSRSLMLGMFRSGLGY